MPERRTVLQHREAILSIAVGHLVVALLDLFGRARFTVDATSPLLQAIADNPLWTGVHLTAAAALIYLVTRGQHRSWLMSFSACVMTAWSGVVLAWAIDATKPVSLLGPMLGMVLALVTITLSRSMAPNDD